MEDTVSETFTPMFPPSAAGTETVEGGVSSERRRESGAHARRSTERKKSMIRFVTATTALAALVASSAAAAATISKQATTASYSLTMNVGPMEAMYTQAQVKAKHPRSGEVMLGGSMMSGSMSGSMGAVERHLEIHVKSRSNGAVVSNVMPTIALTDETKHGMATKLEVVAMEGIGQGAADLHYGNNVALDVGNTYRVTVVVKGETATFTFKAA